MKREKLDLAVARLAATQHGAFSRAQATARGATVRQIWYRLDTERWQGLFGDVYALAEYPETWHRSLIAACLFYGPHAFSSHRSAIALWNLPGIEHGAVEVATPGKRWRSYNGVTVHRLAKPLGANDVAVVDAVPVTSAARSLFDIAGCVEPGLVEEILDHALKRRLVTLARLRAELKAFPLNRPGMAVMRELLRARARPTRAAESRFESRLGAILKVAGFDAIVPQYVVRDRGRFLARVDFAIPQAKIAIEADGFAFHGGLRDHARDAVRKNLLATAGWLVLVFTWRDLEDPGLVTDTVRRALELALARLDRRHVAPR